MKKEIIVVGGGIGGTMTANSLVTRVFLIRKGSSTSVDSR